LVVPVQNAEVAAMFDQAAELLEIEGENRRETVGGGPKWP
jgi:hypothetical protein